MAEVETAASYNITTKNKPSDSKAKVMPAPLEVIQSDGAKLDKQKEQEETALILSRKGTKIGHRRIDEAGLITYKKQPSSALVSAIQLGIQYSVGRLSSKVERDVLMGDFYEIENVFFPSDGRQETPAHHYSDFRFKAYAPVAFRYFRELFHIAPDDFLISLCHEPLRELTNPGASGSLFYLSMDDQFIIKTVQHKEAEFLQKLLPGYYLNLNQNKRTLLPKFFGLYCYQCGGKNIRLIVMNNLLPSGYKIHLKYDLKGSTFKRKASKAERAKSSPTLKDLDFMNDHPDAIALDAETYNLLTKTIQRDCRVLESFKIMDYSLLLAIHNIDEAAREKREARGEPSSTAGTKTTEALSTSNNSNDDGKQSEKSTIELAKGLQSSATVARNPSGRNRDDFSAYWEAIPQHRDDNAATPYGAITARNSRGDRLLLFIGIIDILQSYRLKKRLEHRLKSVVQDGDAISVHRPSFYSKRFHEFMFEKVFRKLPAARPQITRSPSKKRASFNVGKTRDRIRTSSDADKHNKTGENSNDLNTKQSPSLPAGLANIVPGDVSFMGAVSLSPVTSNRSRKSDEMSRSNEETSRTFDEVTKKSDDEATTSEERSKQTDNITNTFELVTLPSEDTPTTSDNVTELTSNVSNISEAVTKQSDDTPEASEVVTEKIEDTPKAEVLTEPSDITPKGSEAVKEENKETPKSTEVVTEQTEDVPEIPGKSSEMLTEDTPDSSDEVWDISGEPSGEVEESASTSEPCCSTAQAEMSDSSSDSEPASVDSHF